MSKLRYDVIVKLYPWIDEIFAQVAEFAHGNASQGEILGAVQWRISVQVRDKHQAAIIDKIEALIGAIRFERIPRPALCPICHSIDTISGACTWCHHEI